MPIKYKILICFSILAVSIGIYGFTDGDSRPISKPTPSPAKTERQAATLEKQATDEDMVAAILIMPKSYLPALKRFSQSAMARDIKIMRAELEVKDGKMTAVRQTKRTRQPNHKIKPLDNPTQQTTASLSTDPSNQKKQIVSNGFLYLLAGFQKHRFVR